MTKIDERSQTAAQLTTANEVLPVGTIVVESDTGLAKMHNGATRWVDLPYWNPAGSKDASFEDVTASGNVTGAGVIGTFAVVSGGAITIGGALDHDGATVGFYGTAPITKRTGVAVTAGGIHAALVSLGLISA